MATEKSLVAIVYEENVYGRQRRPVLKGFVFRQIKEMTVRWAPSYSGHGPFKDHKFQYVELKDQDGKKQRWSFQMGLFEQVADGATKQLPMVTLTRGYRMPDDLFEVGGLIKVY